MKTFKIPGAAIRSIVPGRGSCIASDRITVNGLRVGFMYREEPSDSTDSGWRFLSGEESQEYLDDPGHLAIYDVNTIANYDGDIVPRTSTPEEVARYFSGNVAFSTMSHVACLSASGSVLLTTAHA